VLGLVHQIEMYCIIVIPQNKPTKGYSCLDIENVYEGSILVGYPILVWVNISVLFIYLAATVQLIQS